MDQMNFQETDGNEYEDEMDEDEGGVNKYCTADIWKDGWAAIAKMKVMQNRENTEKTWSLKCLQKFALNKVREMKQGVMGTEIGEELENVQRAAWTELVRGINQRKYL